MPIYVAFPYRFGSDRRTATAGRDDHILQMLEQLLFTNPGERVNRRDFGSGLLQLVFAPNSAEMASALQFTTRAAIQRYMGDLVEVQSLEIVVDDAALRISLTYTVKATGETMTADIEREI
jgi:phage baseplate assembly protein W